MNERTISEINPNVDHVDIEYYYFYGATKVEGWDGTWRLEGNAAPRLRLKCHTVDCNSKYVIEQEIEDAVRRGETTAAEVCCSGNTDKEYAHPTYECEGRVRLVIRPVLKE